MVCVGGSNDNYVSDSSKKNRFINLYTLLSLLIIPYNSLICRVSLKIMKSLWLVFV